jgi:hypothetical protein
MQHRMRLVNSRRGNIATSIGIEISADLAAEATEGRAAAVQAEAVEGIKVAAIIMEEETHVTNEEVGEAIDPAVEEVGSEMDRHITRATMTSSTVVGTAEEAEVTMIATEVGTSEVVERIPEICVAARLRSNTTITTAEEEDTTCPMTAEGIPIITTIVGRLSSVGTVVSEVSVVDTMITEVEEVMMISDKAEEDSGIVEMITGSVLTLKMVIVHAHISYC